MNFTDSLAITMAGLVSCVVIFRLAQWGYDSLVDRLKKKRGIPLVKSHEDLVKMEDRNERTP